MPDILIIPQRGTSNNPSMHFTGSALANIKMEVLPSGSVAFIGTSGSLFNITDSLIGSLMAVGDVSGLPILEVFSDDRVVMGKYGKNTVYVSGANVGIGKVPLNAVLDISGSMAVSGSATVTGSFTTNGRVTFNNGSTGAGSSSTLNVAGDITTYRTSTSGVIYFGTDGSRYLYYDGSNYYMPSGQLYVNAVQVVTNTGTWGISVTGNATSETLSTVTSRGATTAYQIAVSTAAGGSMVTGTKVGSSYGDGVSGATFKSILDNTNGGGAYAFASYYGGVSGTLGASIRADGYSYFSNSVGVGTSSPALNSGYSGLDVINAGYTQLRVRSSAGSGGIEFNSSAGYNWEFQANNSATFFLYNRTQNTYMWLVNSSGNFGIGTTSPNYKLDVNGNSNITGNLTVSGTITGTIAASTVDFTPNFMLMGA